MKTLAATMLLSLINDIENELIWPSTSERRRDLALSFSNLCKVVAYPDSTERECLIGSIHRGDIWSAGTLDAFPFAAKTNELSKWRSPFANVIAHAEWIIDKGDSQL